MRKILLSLFAVANLLIPLQSNARDFWTTDHSRYNEMLDNLYIGLYWGRNNINPDYVYQKFNSNILAGYIADNLYDQMGSNNMNSIIDGAKYTKSYLKDFDQAETEAINRQDKDALWLLGMGYYGADFLGKFTDPTNWTGRGGYWWLYRKLNYNPEEDKLTLPNESGVKWRDYDKAFEYFTQAAELGQKDAMFALSKCYELGNGTEADPAKAQEWMAKYESAPEYTHDVQKDDIAFSIPGDPSVLCYWIKNAQGTKDLANREKKIIAKAGQYDKYMFDLNAIGVKKAGKVGAITYGGKVIVAPKYNKFEGSGYKKRVMFSNPTNSGATYYVYDLNGNLIVSKSFGDSEKHAMASFIKEYLGDIHAPLEIK